jgi:hypothetical protein
MRATASTDHLVVPGGDFCPCRPAVVVHRQSIARP